MLQCPFSCLFHSHRTPDFFNLFIFIFYLFLAALGLCCCTQAFSSCSERGLLFVVVRRLLIAVASLVAEHGALLSMWASVAAARGLSSCGARASLLCGMWDLPGPGFKPVSPALAGRFLTCAAPGKSIEPLILAGHIIAQNKGHISQASLWPGMTT